MSVDGSENSDAARRRPRCGAVLNFLSGKWHRFVLAGILILGGALRLWRLDYWSFWGDECCTPALAEHFSATGLVAFFFDAPLYYYFHQYFIRVFGESDFLLRLPSAILSLLTLVALYHLGKEVHSRCAGLLLAFVAATSWFQVYYGQEARNWALFILTTTATWLFLLRLIRKPKWRNAAGFVLFATASAYSSYAFRFMLVAILFSAVVTGGFAQWTRNVSSNSDTPMHSFLSANRMRWLWLCTSLAVFTLLTFPQFWPDFDKFLGFPKLPEKYANKAIPGVFTTTSAGVGERKSFLNTLYLAQVFDSWGLGRFRTRITPEFAVLLCVALVGLARLIWRRRDAGVLFALSLAVPPILLSVVRFGLSFAPRYASEGIAPYQTALVLGALSVIDLVAFPWAKKWKPHLRLALILLVAMTWSLLSYGPLRTVYTVASKERYRELVRAMMEDARPWDRFLMGSFTNAAVYRHYAREVIGLKQAQLTDLKDTNRTRQYYLICNQKDPTYQTIQELSPVEVRKGAAESLWRFTEPGSTKTMAVPLAESESGQTAPQGWTVVRSAPDSRYAALTTRVTMHEYEGLASVSGLIQRPLITGNVALLGKESSFIGKKIPFLGLGTAAGGWCETGLLFRLSPDCEHIEIYLGLYADSLGTYHDCDFVIVRAQPRRL